MSDKKQKCGYDPRELAGAPIGMFHCPECGEMVVAGMEHHDHSVLEPPCGVECEAEETKKPSSDEEVLFQHAWWRGAFCEAYEFVGRGSRALALEKNSASCGVAMEVARELAGGELTDRKKQIWDGGFLCGFYSSYEDHEVPLDDIDELLAAQQWLLGEGLLEPEEV